VSTPDNIAQHALMLTGGIGGVLLVASLCGLALKLAVSPRAPHALIDNINLRIAAWWAIAAIVGLALLAGHSGVTLLFALAAFAALREYLVDDLRDRRTMAYARVAFWGILPMQFVLAWLGTYTPFALFVPLCVVAAGFAAACLATGPRTFASPVVRPLIGLLLCAYSIAHVPALFALSIPEYGDRHAFLVLYLIVVTQASDVLQYIFGKLCGKHLIAPAISPGKTVEGFLGGVASAIALGAALAWVTPFTTLQAIAISATITLLGFAGGLVFSAIKRKRGIKDWGRLIPGHGGMLDRIDSLAFSAPAFYYIVRLGWAT